MPAVQALTRRHLLAAAGIAVALPASAHSSASASTPEPECIADLISTGKAGGAQSQSD